MTGLAGQQGRLAGWLARHDGSRAGDVTVTGLTPASPSLPHLTPASLPPPHTHTLPALHCTLPCACCTTHPTTCLSLYTPLPHTPCPAMWHAFWPGWSGGGVVEKGEANWVYRRTRHSIHGRRKNPPSIPCLPVGMAGVGWW